MEPCKRTGTSGENVQRGPAGMVEHQGLPESMVRRVPLSEKREKNKWKTIKRYKYCHEVSERRQLTNSFLELQVHF